MDPFLEEMIKPFLHVNEPTSIQNKFPLDENLLAAALASIPLYEWSKIPKNAETAIVINEMRNDSEISFDLYKALREQKAEEKAQASVTKDYWNKERPRNLKKKSAKANKSSELEKMFITRVLSFGDSGDEENTGEFLDENNDITLPVDFLAKHKMNKDTEYKSSDESEESEVDMLNSDTDYEDEEDEAKAMEELKKLIEKKEKEPVVQSIPKREIPKRETPQPISIDKKLKFRFSDQGVGSTAKDVLIKEPEGFLLLGKKSEPSSLKGLSSKSGVPEEETDIKGYKALLLARALISTENLDLDYGDLKEEFQTKVNYRDIYKKSVDKEYFQFWDEVLAQNTIVEKPEEKPSTSSKKLPNAPKLPKVPKSRGPSGTKPFSKKEHRKSLKELDDEFFESLN